MTEFLIAGLVGLIVSIPIITCGMTELKAIDRKIEEDLKMASDMIKNDPILFECNGVTKLYYRKDGEDIDKAMQDFCNEVLSGQYKE